MSLLHAAAASLGISSNTLVVTLAMAAVGMAAGVVGCFSVLRRRALVGDAAAHATLPGVAAAFLLTGSRSLPVLLAGGAVSAVISLGLLVLLRRFTRTREDAATAIVIGVSFGVGVALISGLVARGVPGSGGLERFLLGSTASLSASEAVLLVLASLVATGLVIAFAKEAIVVSFDPGFAAAAGWPVWGIDFALVAITAVMVVVGLPAAGAVLVTALVVIPPVAARQWTDRVGVMLCLAGVFGLVAALAGVVVSAVVPGLATGPMVVLAAAAVFAVSLVCAPKRGLLAMAMRPKPSIMMPPEGPRERSRS